MLQLINIENERIYFIYFYIFFISHISSEFVFKYIRYSGMLTLYCVTQLKLYTLDINIKHLHSGSLKFAFKIGYFVSSDYCSQKVHKRVQMHLLSKPKSWNTMDGHFRIYIFLYIFAGKPYSTFWNIWNFLIWPQTEMYSFWILYKEFWTGTQFYEFISITGPRWQCQWCCNINPPTCYTTFLENW